MSQGHMITMTSDLTSCDFTSLHHFQITHTSMKKLAVLAYQFTKLNVKFKCHVNTGLQSSGLTDVRTTATMGNKSQDGTEYLDSALDSNRSN